MNEDDFLKLLSECPTINDKFWLVDLQMKLESQK